MKLPPKEVTPKKNPTGRPAKPAQVSLENDRKQQQAENKQSIWDAMGYMAQLKISSSRGRMPARVSLDNDLKQQQKQQPWQQGQRKVNWRENSRVPHLKQLRKIWRSPFESVSTTTIWINKQEESIQLLHSVSRTATSWMVWLETWHWKCKGNNRSTLKCWGTLERVNQKNPSNKKVTNFSFVAIWHILLIWASKADGSEDFRPSPWHWQRSVPYSFVAVSHSLSMSAKNSNSSLSWWRDSSDSLSRSGSSAFYVDLLFPPHLQRQPLIIPFKK